MENKYNRVVAASLLAIRKLLTSLPANQIESCIELLRTLLEKPNFWKHGKSKLGMVRSSLYLNCLFLLHVVYIKNTKPTEIDKWLEVSYRL